MALRAQRVSRIPRRRPNRRLHASEAQAVTFVELFFDLVFVFAVTQVTSLTEADLTWSGIIAFAVAMEEIVAHPRTVPRIEVVVALGAAVVLFVGCSALAYWRTSRRLLVRRLVILGLGVAGLAVVSRREPAWMLGVLAVALAAIVVVEGDGPIDAEEPVSEVS